MLHKVKYIAVAATLAVVSSMSVTPAAAAGSDTSLLLLPQDQRADALPVNSRVVNKVFQSIEENLEDEGVVMFSRHDVSRAGLHQADRPMGDKKLARFARNQVRPRGEMIDAVMTMNIEARRIRDGARHYLELRAVGRMVDVDTGKRLQLVVINDPIDPIRLKKDCRRQACVNKKLQKHAHIIGAEIADRLVENRKWRRALRQAAANGRPVKKLKKGKWKQNDYRQVSSFDLSLIGFDQDLVDEILDLLPESDKGFRRIKPVREGSWSTHVAYVTDSSREDIKDRLVSMFVSLGVDARIARAPDGFMISELDDRDVSWLRQDRDGEDSYDLDEW